MSPRIHMLLAFALLSVLLFTPSARAEDIECDASIIDVGAKGTKVAEPAPVDVYVLPQRKMAVRTDNVFKVYRPVTLTEESGRNHSLKAYIGRLQILEVRDEVLVGRMIEFASEEEYPRVRYETVMIGDCLALEIVPDEAEEKPEESVADEAPTAEMPVIRRIIPTKILFKFDSAHIEEKWSDELERLAGFITELKPIKVVVEGHACWIGSEAYNVDLSRRRARAVVDYLVSNYGLEKELFEIQAYGESRPEASNESADGRRKNRRAATLILYQTVPGASEEASIDWSSFLFGSEPSGPNDMENDAAPAELPDTGP